MTYTSRTSTSKIFFTVFLAVMAFAIGIFAEWQAPLGTYPANSEPAVSMGLSNDVKMGALGVKGFLARGETVFKQGLVVNGGIQSGYPPAPSQKYASTVTIGSSVLATGDIKTSGSLNSTLLKHTEAKPKPLCNDANGNIVFCGALPPPFPSIACNTTSSGTRPAGSGFSTYPEIIYDLGPGFSGTHQLLYTVYNVPNRFTIYTYPGNTLVATTGWKGDATYPGPWGQPPFSDSAQNPISFTATQQYYKVIVETSTGPTDSDSWDANLRC